MKLPRWLKLGRAKREPQQVIIRDYDAGRNSDLFADFRLDGGWVPATVAEQLPQMRARSRQEAKNNPWVKRILDLARVNIVGENGFRYVPRPPSGMEKIDKGAADILKKQFYAWASNPDFCDVAGKLDLVQIEWLIVTQLYRDGEAVVRMHSGYGYPDNPFAFALEVLNPAMLDAKLNVEKSGGIKGMQGTAIINGVEIDKYGKPLAYWFKKRDATNLIYSADYAWASDGWTRVPAKEILHIYDPTMSEQTRGVPLLYSAIMSLHMLAKYEDAELVAARKDANITTTYESAGQSDPDHIAKPADVQKAVGASVAGSDSIVPYGWTRKFHAPSRPNQAFADFDKAQLRKVASAAGTAYNVLANDLEGVTYSSLRDGKLTERDIYKRMQSLVIRRFCRPVNLAWLKMFLGSPRSPLPITNYDRYAVHQWRGRRWAWVDPRAEAQYNQTCRDNGWLTDQEIAESLGADFSENVEEIKQAEQIVAGTYLEDNYVREPDQQTGQSAE